MSADALLKWKAQIFEYQQRVRESNPIKQVSLFDLAPKHCDSDQIDPLTMRLESMAFYRMPADYPGECDLKKILDRFGKKKLDKSQAEILITSLRNEYSNRNFGQRKWT